MSGEKEVREALERIKHPKLKKSFLSLKMIRDIVVEGDTVALTLAMKSERSPLLNRLKKQIHDVLLELPGIDKVVIDVTTLSKEELEWIFPRPRLRGIERVKHIVAVASGKGGVGKTTVAINLALALNARGLTVGLMDADVYGPSIPVMLDMHEEPEEKGNIVTPLEKFGLRIMSLGMSVGPDDPFIWRGPLVSKMIHNLLDKVEWGELDYLVIDLPPGTGDPSIAIAQSLPECRIVMVTTPPKVALADVQRAIVLFRKYGLHITGLVENMSSFRIGDMIPVEIFGHGGAEQLSLKNDLPLLAAIPLDLAIRQSEDQSLPLMVAAPDSEAGRVFQDLAEKVAVEEVVGS